MSSSKVMSSPRKRLSLMKKDVDGYNTRNNRSRIDDTNTNNENTQAREKDNFMKMCLQVSYEAFQHLQKRFQILNLPECYNICNHVSEKISSSAEACFNIDLSSNCWCDALDVCINCIISGQYLSGSILKNIVEIIMNAHEDIFSGDTMEYNMLRKCQNTLLLNFSMHPPCYESDTRDCYKEFLLTAMDDKNENEFTNRKEHSSDKGIVAHCFDRLMYEISKDSKDGILFDKHINEVYDGVRGLYWKKQNQELYEFMERTERIKRLMTVLESIIHLLQVDLALWHRGYHNRSKVSGKNRCQKPIISYLLWPNNTKMSDRNTNFNFGSVSLLCYQIMKLFAYFVHLEYPEEYITTMSLWMNAVAQILYISENFLKTDYPSPSTFCIRFSQEFCNIIKSLPSHSILRILQKLQPSFMRYLVGECYIKSLPHTPDKDIINIIKSCVEDAIWEKYPGDSLCLLPGIVKNVKLLLHRQSKRYKNCEVNSKDLGSCTAGESPNPYPKLELDFKKSNSKIQRSFFVNVLFITVIAYLETYNIRDFRHRLQILNTVNTNDCDVELNIDYVITVSFVKKYTSIISALKMLFQLLDGKKDKFSIKLLQLLKEYLS